MPAFQHVARRIVAALPTSLQDGVRAATRAVRSRREVLAATVAVRIGAADAWRDAFEACYERAPSSEELVRLGAIALTEGQVSPRRRFRKVLAAFDRKDHYSAFSVNWGADDVQLRRVGDFSMYLDPTDEFVSGEIERATYETHVVSFLGSFLQPGMHFVDAGANVGFYSLMAAQCVGPEGVVSSFEPNSENCRLLLASAQANGFSNIMLHPVALGNFAGHTYFTAALGSNGMIQEQWRRDILHPSCRIVPVRRLDDHGIERIDAMKMDIEGAEGMLVDGGRATLERCRPVIVTEFSPVMLQITSGWSAHQFLGFFTKRGYNVFVLRKNARQIDPVEDIGTFAGEFVGTDRMEDLLLCPQEKLPLIAQAC